MKTAVLVMASISTALATDWTTFQDPIEKAFTVDIPQGWTVKGGLFRLGYSDARAMVDAQSPDGKIDVRLGDVAIPVYFVPNRLHPREGENYDLGAQAQMRVADYRSGPSFAPLYATARFRNVCPDLHLELTDSPLSMADYQPEQIAPMKKSSGQATYDCGGKTAAVYSTTELYNGFWTVSTLGSLLASRDQAAFARTVLTRMARSLQLTPQWIAYQKKMDAEAIEYQKARQQARRREISQQVAQFEMKMHAMQDQVSRFERRQAGQASQVTAWGNVLTGITPTTDPFGNPRDVWTGSKSGYWVNGTGRVVNSDTSPGPGWQPLTPKQ